MAGIASSDETVFEKGVNEIENLEWYCIINLNYTILQS